jgi:hypothetical protein
MLATLPENIDEKMLTSFQKMLTKKCSQHFQKILTKKYLQQFKSNKKSQSTWVFLGDLNILSGLFWAFLGFIVHILIHLPQVIYEPPFLSGTIILLHIPNHLLSNPNHQYKIQQHPSQNIPALHKYHIIGSSSTHYTENITVTAMSKLGSQ